MQENNNQRQIEKDEIDLMKLLIILWNKKIFIMVFTAIVLISVIGYVYSKAPIYKAIAFIKMGKKENKLLHNRQYLIEELNLERLKNKDIETILISLPKKNKDKIKITIKSTSKEKAIRKIKDIVSSIVTAENKEIERLKNIEQEKNNLYDKEIFLLEESIADSTTALTAISLKDEIDSMLFNEKSRLKELITSLKLKIVKLKYKKSENQTSYKNSIIFGEINISNNSKSVRKKFIGMGGIIGFILAVSLVLLMQFIQNLNKKESENERI